MGRFGTGLVPGGTLCHGLGSVNRAALMAEPQEKQLGLSWGLEQV